MLKSYLLLIIIVFLNSCCFISFKNDNEFDSIDKFYKKIQVDFPKDKIFAIYNTCNLSSCQPIEYNISNHSDTSYVLIISNTNTDNKNPYFEIYKYVDNRQCSKEKVGFIKEDYSKLNYLVDLYLKDIANKEIQNYYNEYQKNHKEYNISMDNDFSVHLYSTKEFSIDNCRFNNTNGLFIKDFCKCC